MSEIGAFAQWDRSMPVAFGIKSVFTLYQSLIFIDKDLEDVSLHKP